jgi:ferredoxin-NADP reductase
MLTLPHDRSYICFSQPGPLDKVGEDFDARGRLSPSMIDVAGVPRDADVYLCGPNRFVADMTAGLSIFGIA